MNIPYLFTLFIIPISFLILIFQHLIVLNKSFNLANMRINQELKISLDIARSLYQGNQNKIPSEIPNKVNEKGSS
jgi:hypothetical protein